MWSFDNTQKKSHAPAPMEITYYDDVEMVDVFAVYMDGVAFYDDVQMVDAADVVEDVEMVDAGDDDDSDMMEVSA